MALTNCRSNKLKHYQAIDVQSLLAEIKGEGGCHSLETDSGLEVTCNLNGIVSNQAKLEFQIWVREPKPEGHIGRYRPKQKKLDPPDEIIQLSGQAYKFIWNGFPIDQHSRYKLKYKVDLYGDGKIAIPGRYDKDGWTEEWL